MVPPPVSAGVPVIPKTAFFLSTDMFHLIYGDCYETIASRTEVVAPGPHDVAHLNWSQFAETEVLFTGWSGPRLDAEVLRRLPALRAVFHGGGTVGPIVSDAFWQRGIPISSAAAANAIPVAEYTLGVVLLALRRAWTLSRQARARRHFQWSPRAAPGLRGATVGLISLGFIGREVRRLLRPFDVRVVAHDPHLSPAQFADLQVESVTLPDLMRQSDVVSLHTPVNAQTRGFITGELLRQMKPDSTLINSARGELIHEPDLIAFLRDRPDVQAVLDVTSPEPPETNSGLYDLENVFLTPHIAGSMGRECHRMGWLMAEELDRYLRGEPLLHAVIPDATELRS